MIDNITTELFEDFKKDLLEVEQDPSGKFEDFLLKWEIDLEVTDD